MGEPHGPGRQSIVKPTPERALPDYTIDEPACTPADGGCYCSVVSFPADLVGDVTVDVSSPADLAGDVTVVVSFPADLAGDLTIGVSFLAPSAVAEVVSLADFAEAASSADLAGRVIGGVASLAVDEVASLTDIAGDVTVTIGVSFPAVVEVVSSPDLAGDVTVGVTSLADPIQEEITHRVELEYRLFLSIDSSLYRPKTIFFRGCAKFRPLAFFISNMAAATAKYH